MKADKLILGNVITLDPRNPVMKAVTVKDGLVQYVGSERMARKLCDENTEVMDYGDNYIYPGFIEAHCHGAMAGPRLAFYAALNDGQTMDEYVEILKKYIDEHPDNNFYYGAGWAEKDKEPTAAMLDAICTDKPIALNSVDGHSLWFNTKGMEVFGINEEAVKTWGTDIIRVNEDGTPTGYISEGPVISILTKMGKMSDEDLKKAFLVWQDFALSQGITAYYEAGVTDHYLEIIDQLIKEGKVKLRIFAGYMLNERDEDYVVGVEKAKAAALKYNNEHMKIIGVKIFMDGVVEAHTAWMDEEYTDRPGYFGVKRFCDLDRVVELYKAANCAGLNVHQHTIGDGAVRFALDCMEEAQTQMGKMDNRNALCHLQVVRKEDVKRLCELNAIAVVAPLWMARADGYYEQSVKYIGEKRTFYGYPLKSFTDNSGIYAFHTDFPVSPEMSIPRSIFMACQRNQPDSEEFYQWNANECISREDAIKGLTAGPAYSVKAEDHLGALMIGYAANMCVYDTDFIHADIEDVPKGKLLATIIDGDVAYEAE